MLKACLHARVKSVHLDAVALFADVRSLVVMLDGFRTDDAVTGEESLDLMPPE